MRYIQGENRGQVTVFPATIDEYVGSDNPVRVIDAFVNTLDIDKAGFKALPEWIGRPGYDPRTLLKLYIYGYFNKTRSSRRLMAECYRNVEVMWLLGKLAPDFRTIADFRSKNADAMKKVFRAFVKICSDLDLYAKELEAIDGSKFRAVNAKDKNITKAKLEAKIQRAEAKLEEYLKELDQNDQEDINPENHTPGGNTSQDQAT
ncbi:MAG: transposase [Peptococcaceae bacterium]|jgi:transposase|nr:transposase [Peptococcaceae bacterium]